MTTTSHKYLANDTPLLQKTALESREIHDPDNFLFRKDPRTPYEGQCNVEITRLPFSPTSPSKKFRSPRYPQGTMLTSPAPTQGPSPPPARPLEQSSSASYAPQTSPTPMNTSTSTQHRDKLLIGPGLERIPIIKKHSAKANEAQNSSAQRKPSQPIPFNPNGTAPHKRSRTSSSSESSSEEGGGTYNALLINRAKTDKPK